MPVSRVERDTLVVCVSWPGVPGWEGTERGTWKGEGGKGVTSQASSGENPTDMSPHLIISITGWGSGRLLGSLPHLQVPCLFVFLVCRDAVEVAITNTTPQAALSSPVRVGCKQYLHKKKASSE